MTNENEVAWARAFGDTRRRLMMAEAAFGARETFANALALQQAAAGMTGALAMADPPRVGIELLGPMATYAELLELLRGIDETLEHLRLKFNHMTGERRRAEMLMETFIAAPRGE